MKNTVSWAGSVDGEENIGALVNRLRKWIKDLPERAKVRVSARASVKDEDEAREASRTPDMFHNGKVRNGVQRKEKVRKHSAKKKAAPVQGADPESSEGVSANGLS